jgi:hypothetical protein
MPRHGVLLVGAVFGLAVIAPLHADAQDWTRREFPLAPPNSNDNFVAPYFDGFHQNADGTYTMSFGFMNRNDSELIEIPLGADNFIEPAEFDGDQPTSFPTVRYSGFGGPRERGTFGVVVPADFQGDVWWTLTTDGYTTRVPGRLESPGRLIKGAYELGTSPMARGSLRPIIRFTEGAPDSYGIVGVQHPDQFTTAVGEPIEVQFWALDRGERELGYVNMTLWKHQGPVPGLIAFESLVEAPPARQGRSARGGGAAAAGRAGRGGRRGGPGPVAIGRSVRIPTEGAAANIGHFKATFDTPGDYVIRIRIDSFSNRDSAPGNQCCWSNGYVRVRVNE